MDIFVLARGRKRLIVAVILFLYVMVGMGIDALAPALPAISVNLGTGAQYAKNLIAGYLLGYSLASFLIGFLVDALGRRWIILLALSVFLLASFFPAWFALPAVVLAGRFFQGFAMGAYSVGARGVLANILTQPELLKTAPLISTAFGLGPIIGPVIGAYLQFYFGWRACFYFFALIDILGLFLMLIALPETHLEKRPFRLNTMLKDCRDLFSHLDYLSMIIMMGLAYSCIIAFNTLAPFIIQNGMHLSAIEYGHIGLYLGTVFFIATLISRRLLKQHVPVDKILRVTILLSLAIALAGILISYALPSSPYFLVGLSSLLFLSTGIIYPCGMAKGSVMFRHLAGSSSAVMNLVIFLITGVTSFCLSFIHAANTISLSLVYGVLFLLIIITMRLAGALERWRRSLLSS